MLQLSSLLPTSEEFFNMEKEMKLQQMEYIVLQLQHYWSQNSKTSYRKPIFVIWGVIHLLTTDKYKKLSTQDLNRRNRNKIAG